MLRKKRFRQVVDVLDIRRNVTAEDNHLEIDAPSARSASMQLLTEP